MNLEEMSYEERCKAAIPRQGWDTRYEPGEWNTIYLAGLFRMGLMLTTHEAYTLMGDMRYPNGKPMRAPLCDDEALWPKDTWIIYRD